MNFEKLEAQLEAMTPEARLKMKNFHTEQIMKNDLNLFPLLLNLLDLKDAGLIYRRNLFTAFSIGRMVENMRQSGERNNHSAADILKVVFSVLNDEHIIIIANKLIKE